MNNEMPDVAYSNYGSAQALSFADQQLDPLNQQTLNQMAMLNQFNQARGVAAPSPVAKEQALMAPPARRLVQVFVVDPHDSVPLDQCLLYRGELQLTDSTDQELFFAIDIKTILDRHNEKRVKIIDKRVRERVEHLEPARIRDLKMQIVEVAKF